MSYNHSSSYKSCCACKKSKCSCKVSCYKTCKKICVKPCCPPPKPCLPPCPPPKCETRWSIRRLVSNQVGYSASNVDNRLINPWGIIYMENVLWVSNNGSAYITTYDPDGTKRPLTISVHRNKPIPEMPTGIVWNSTSDFGIANGDMTGPGIIFVSTEAGCVNGWNGNVSSTETVIVVNQEGQSVFKGLTIAATNMFATDNFPKNYIYVADFLNGVIKAFDKDFNQATLPAGAFEDGDINNPLPSDFCPFNITLINSYLYVLYAKKNPGNTAEALPGCGNGYINVFQTDGTFVKRFASRGDLNAPWAMILAPCSCGLPEGSFLVSNHGDGTISAFSKEGFCLGKQRDTCGKIISVEGLWGLAGAPNGTVYFTAGLNNESDGLLGSITPVDVIKPYPYPCCPYPYPSYPNNYYQGGGYGNDYFPGYPNYFPPYYPPNYSSNYQCGPNPYSYHPFDDDCGGRNTGYVIKPKY